MRKAMILGLATAGITMALTEPAAALRWGDKQSGPCGVTLSNGYRFNCTRIVSYILWDIPWGKSWETTCAATPGPSGWPVPKRCMKVWPNIHIRGYWEFKNDPTCAGGTNVCGTGYSW